MNQQAEFDPMKYTLETALEWIVRICNDYDLPQLLKDRYTAPEVKSTDTSALVDGHILEAALATIREHLQTAALDAPASMGE